MDVHDAYLRRAGDAGARVSSAPGPVAGNGLDVGQNGFALPGDQPPGGVDDVRPPEAVEISWAAQGNAQGQTIVRDNVKIEDLGPGVDYYQDSKITPGATHQYIVTPASLTKGTHPVWGMKITVPQAKAGEEKVDTLGRYADIRPSAAAAEGETTVTWETFIPQAKVDAPPIGCEHGGGYQFGGDNPWLTWYRPPAAPRGRKACISSVLPRDQHGKTELIGVYGNA
ncbi:hypothetical protein [Streptosporangium sandarakinum]